MRLRAMGLKSFLLWSAALPIWLFLIGSALNSTGFGGGPVRYVVAPMVLGGITWALSLLFEDQRGAVPVCALLAAVVALAALTAGAVISNSG